MNVSNTASTYAGRAIQMIKNNSRGANAPKSASKQPIPLPLSYDLGDYMPLSPSFTAACRMQGRSASASSDALDALPQLDGRPHE